MTGLQNADNPGPAGFPWRDFARCLRRHRGADDRGLRGIGSEIGVTINDLSRAMGGQHVEAQKIIAMCDWMGRDIHEFYIPPDHVSRAKCFTFTPVEQSENIRITRNGDTV